jgi:transposase
MIRAWPWTCTCDGSRRRPLRVALGDKAYGTPGNHRGCARRGIVSLLAAPRQWTLNGLGLIRYVVERTLAWFGHFRRLRTCYERNETHLQAFHELTAALICSRRIET